MHLAVDQTGKNVNAPDPVRRIISVVPSQTELLFELGLNTEVAGITRYCIHPQDWFRSKPHVGGTKNLDIEKIRSLRPDLIIANKEENEQAQIEELALEFPVWVSDVKSYADAKKMIIAIGTITNRYFEAIRILQKADVAFDELRSSIVNNRKRSVAYLIWNKPMMAAGGDTFINSMLECCGFTNSFRSMSRYPDISDAQIIDTHPEYIFLSSEPYPFSKKHLSEFNRRFPGIRSICTNGEMFSWYGSRLQYSPSYFQKLLEQIDSEK